MVTKDERKQVQLLNRDIALLQAEGVRTALIIAARIRRDPTNVRKYIALLKPILTRAMVAAHLTAAYRVHRETPRPVIRLSAYDTSIKFLENRLKLSHARVLELQKQYDATALTMLKGAADKIENSLQKTMLNIHSKGMHVREAKKELDKTFKALGISPANSFTLEAIFRTQTQMAYSVGRWQADQDPDIQEILWGYKYVTVGDDRVRPEHLALEGITLPKDDPRWNTIFPPNGWACRCQAIPIFEERKTVEPKDVVEINGKIVVPGADKGFAFNPGQIFGDMPLPTPTPIKIDEAVRVKFEEYKQAQSNIVDLLQKPIAEINFDTAPVEVVKQQIANNSFLKSVGYIPDYAEDVIRQTGKHLQSLHIRHPELVERLKALNTDLGSLRITEGSLSHPGYAGEYWARDHRINLKFRNKPYTSEFKPGQWVAGNGDANTLMHEFGHHINEVFTRQHSMDDLYNSQTKQYWKATVSQYGATNSRELFAEAFEIYTRPTYVKGTLPAEMERVFERMFSGKATTWEPIPHWGKVSPNIPEAPVNKFIRKDWDVLPESEVKELVTKGWIFDSEIMGDAASKEFVKVDLREAGKRMSSLFERHPELEQKLQNSKQFHKPLSLEFTSKTIPGQSYGCNGLCDWNNGRVIIRRGARRLDTDWKPGTWITGKGDVNTLMHELGHALDARLGSIKNNLAAIYKQESPKFWQKTVSKYAATNHLELFAEAFEVYSRPGYGLPGTPRLPAQIEARFEQLFGKIRK